MPETTFRRPADILPVTQLDVGEVMARPDFQEWVGEIPDKVVSEDGHPVVFYHGGRSGVKEFSRDYPLNTGPDQKGFYFSPRVHDARAYSDKVFVEHLEAGNSPEASMYAVFLKATSPLVTGGEDFNSAGIYQQPEGHDMVINPRSQEVVVFDPSQIYIAAEVKR